MRIKKYETKDRYGNSKSFEFFEGSDSIDVPGMTNMPDHPGAPRGTDTVPAWLTPGEFVINKEATDKYGPLLKEINDEGREMQQGQPMYAATGTPVRRDNEAMSSIVTSTDWIDDDLLDNLKLIESGGRHFNDDGTLVTSPAGAVGAYQWMPSSAAKPPYGIQGFDATTISEEGMRAKTKKYLEQIQRHNPSWDKERVLRAYNAGPFGDIKKLDTEESKDNFNESGKSPMATETYNYPYKVIQGTQTPDYNIPNVIDTSVGDEPMVDPAITQEILGPDIQTLDDQIKDTEAELASIKKEEVATEDPSFLDRAGDFLSDVLSNYRDKRKAYNRQLSQGFFNMPTLMPEYYAEGDEVRDYYRSGIPMPGSAPTYNYSSAPTFEIMADNIKSKLEKEEAERVRKAYEERFGAVDQLSMDRLTSMRLKNKLDNLKREREALNLKRLQLDASSKGTREDAFNKNYYTGVPGDVPSADEFMNIPKDIMPPKIEEEVLKAYDPKFYDAFGNSYDDAEQASKSDLINEADSKAAMQRQMQKNSLGQLDPITDKNFYDLPASEAASLDDANLSLYQDMDVPEVKESEIVKNTPTKKEIEKLVKDKYAEVGLGNYKPLIPESFATSWGQHFNNVGFKDLNDVVGSKNKKVLDAKNALINAIQKGAPQKQIDILKQRWKEATQGAALANDTAIVTERHQDKYRIDKQLEEAKLLREQTLLKIQRLKEAGLLEEAEKERLALIEKEKQIKELEIEENNAAELFDTSFTGKTESGNVVTEGIAAVVNGDPSVTGGKEEVVINTNTDKDGSALTNRLNLASNLSDGSENSVSTNAQKVKNKGEKVVQTGNGKQQQDKAEGFLKKFFGDLLDTDELKRMAILYVGSRAMGASHNGSLAWAGKYYLKRVETKDARHAKNVEKVIASKLYKASSIEKYKKSRNLNHLERINTSGAFDVLGNRKEFYNPSLQKAREAIEIKKTKADGTTDTYYTFNARNPDKPGYRQPIGTKWITDPSRVKGTTENIKLRKDLKAQYVNVFKELQARLTKTGGGGESPGSNVQDVAIGPEIMAGQLAQFASEKGLPFDELSSIAIMAHENMLAAVRADPTYKPQSITPWIEAGFIRSAVATIDPNLFGDAVTPKNVNAIKKLNEAVAGSTAYPTLDWASTKGRDELSDKWKMYHQLFTADLSAFNGNPSEISVSDINGKATKLKGESKAIEIAKKNTQPDETLFMSWLRRELRSN